MKELLSNEYKLEGQWINTHGEAKLDETSERIEWLVENSLKLLGKSSDGWNSLYLDPEDQRLWELTYPNSDSHGGGPPTLTFLDRDKAKKKYDFNLAGGV